jgi:hypothetical protein
MRCNIEVKEFNLSESKGKLPCQALFLFSGVLVSRHAVATFVDIVNAIVKLFDVVPVELPGPCDMLNGMPPVVRHRKPLWEYWKVILHRRSYEIPSSQRNLSR